MPGWSFNVAIGVPAFRFYTFNLTARTFLWWRSNDTFSDTEDIDEVPIKDMADISYLLEFIHVNAESLREKPSLPIIKGNKFQHFAPFYPKWEDLEPDMEMHPLPIGGKALLLKKMAAIEAMKKANSEITCYQTHAKPVAITKDTFWKDALDGAAFFFKFIKP